MCVNDNFKIKKNISANDYGHPSNVVEKTVFFCQEHFLFPHQLRWLLQVPDYAIDTTGPCLRAPQFLEAPP